MLTVKQAESIILEIVKPLDKEKDTEIVTLETALNRILATEVTSQLDFPYWDNSAMDGYAVKFTDIEKCDINNPKILEIIEEIPAGYQPKKTIKLGQTSRIFTGGMLPNGGDTIVIQENTEKQKDSNKVKIFSPSKPQEFVRKKGEYYQAGKPLLNSGVKIHPAEIAVLATSQCNKLKVYRRPKIAILSTGNELINPNQTLKPGQIIDSNQYAIAAFISQLGGIPIQLGIIPDDKEALKKVISQAILQADFVVSTGGVSVGDYDYIQEILTSLGGKIEIQHVAVKPGKPLTVATFANTNCIYFGIPGNPVSALVSCWRFLSIAIKKLSGLSSNWLPVFVKGISRDELKTNGKRETYLWGKLSIEEGKNIFHLAGGSHSSGNLINLAQTNALAVIPIGKNVIPAGEEFLIMSLDN